MHYIAAILTRFQIMSMLQAPTDSKNVKLFDAIAKIQLHHLASVFTLRVVDRLFSKPPLGIRLDVQRIGQFHEILGNGIWKPVNFDDLLVSHEFSMRNICMIITVGHTGQREITLSHHRYMYYILCAFGYVRFHSRSPHILHSKTVIYL